MSLAVTLHQLMESYRGKTRTIRQQRCKRCWTTLAIQATNDVESAAEGEYYIVNGGLVVEGEFQALYQKSGRWFGNPVSCPKCGLSGRLPMDKPYNWEAMQRQRKGEYENARR